MVRRSVNDARVFHGKHRFSDRMSDISETFLAEIHHALGGDILPGTFGMRFKPADAPLYISKRRWVMPTPEVPCPFAHEEYLHSRYWPSKLSQDHVLVVVKGAPGVGKSTLLRYYCDCYLPWYHDFAHARGHISGGLDWADELAKHIFMYVNLHPPVVSLERAQTHILRTFRATIEAQIPGISVENNYAMWARVARWDDPVRRAAEDASGDRHAYRAKWVDQHLDNDRLFVEESLWYLCSMKDDKGGRRYYVTQIFDNMDLLDFEIQESLLRDILAGLADGGCQWKVFICLRPQTLARLNHLLAPIPPKTTIEVGPPDIADLLSTRRGSLDSQILESGKQVERDRYVREGRHRTIVFQPMPNFRVRECIKRILSLRFGDGPHRSSFDVVPHRLSEEFVVKFCNGSIRRFLRLMLRLLASTPMQRAAELQELHRGEVLPHYTFLSAILTGPRDYFDANDDENDIMNLFAAIPSGQDAPGYASQVGIHVMYLLLQGRCFKKTDVIHMLTIIGYKQEEVEECLEYMYGKSFFSRDVIDRAGDYRIDVESEVLEAYRKLVPEPAYIDAMALVTPVEDQLIKARKMRHTTSYAIGEFRQRVTTSLGFLQQIRDDERTVRTWRRDSPRHGMTTEVFAEGFRTLNFPSVYRKAALEYRKRLEGLRDEPKGLAEVMADRHWDALLRDSVLEVDAKMADVPLDAILPGSPGDLRL